ncbi:MAG: ricin-type beta-trefoil lectin domain protein [Pseudomonadota bacterium]
MNATMKLGVSSVLLMLAGGLATYAPTASAQVAPLKNTGNSRCMAVNASGGAITQACNGSTIQRWTQTNTGSGFLIRNAATGLCLNSNAGSVFTSACNSGNPSQRWLRLNVSATSARYRSSATGLFVGSTSTGAVVVGPGSASPLQIWAY